MPADKRVVVTGVGAVSAAGVGAETLWTAARDGRSCITPPVFPYEYRGRIKIAAQVQGFVATDHLERDVLPLCDPVSMYLLVAADEAIAQAGYDRATRFGPRGATIIGTGIGGMITIEEGIHKALVLGGRPHPLMVPKLIPSACPANVSIRYGLEGPSFAVVSACSSATQAIGIGMQMIRGGVVDVAVVGGTEDHITNNAMLAWEALRVMTPDFCRPFSKGRNGMVLGAGAGVVVLESEDHAKARGGKVLAYLDGYGTTTDAKDMVSPDLEGAARAMALALADADAKPDDIDYVNAHGTATIVNDSTESAALHKIFGERGAHVPVSSTKPIHGHGLGAAGVLEFVVSMGAIREQIAPPTINFLEPDEKCPVDAIPNEARPLRIRTVMSNSFAFGGINAVLVIRAPEAA
ncbi:Nodulation protein E [Beijerinckiaceae bacterium RH AL1]|nr:beta-ketoacyl-[acyl-carrier-protein] synthase family protein [Beijerinckiaceae bacterium]VVB48853.1 Nodulation protein E [Beijerinckiaceae bacterium RH CH11]VVB48930.1 Nodulation protein E [Beijerinckiaceae bacterium RH AL8]VVC56600.1 Nodulation protein E [Beijerinckiaceae bacterium RH AL1]